MENQTPDSVLSVEAECQAKNLNAPATHSSTLNKRIARVEYVYNAEIPMMTCVLFSVNDFKFVGTNLIVSRENFDMELSKKLAYAQAYGQFQSHEAYLLKETLYDNSKSVEMVATVNATALKRFFDIDTQNPTNKVEPFSLLDLSLSNISFVPRDFADNKSPASLKMGRMQPQLLPYYVVVNEFNEVLVYNRKGKEKGLTGKYSLGIGGHIDQGDFTHNMTISQLVTTAALREINEELGVDYSGKDILPERCIYTDVDATSTVHFGITNTIKVVKSECNPDPSEFLNPQWIPLDQLVEFHKGLLTQPNGPQFETWSKLLIEAGI